MKCIMVYVNNIKESITRGFLFLFHYYGIHDKTDYSNLYKENKTCYDLIYKYYKKYRSKRAIGFCCSKVHAESMAKEFCKRDVSSQMMIIKK